MLNELLAQVRRYDMICPGDTVVCGVSGGADSMALLWSLYLLKDKLDIRLCAAHYNHALRGAESDRDEAFVREFCTRHDIPLYVGRGQVVSGKKGLEAAARDARYAYFDTLPGKLATAHTADDNAETVLMHLLRGTGLKGLGGIAPVSGKRIRPMLTVTRQQVMQLLEEYHIPHVLDSSNETDVFLRNRLRHHVMPLLKQENPRLAENLSAMAMRLRQDEQALMALADVGELPEVEDLQQLHPAIRSRMLEKFLKQNGVREPEAAHICLLEKLVYAENPSARAEFPGGITVCRNYGKLEVLKSEDPLGEILLPENGQLQISQLGLQVTVCPAQEIVNTTSVFTVTASGQLRLRCRQGGDEIRLPGGTKTLKKLMIDRKIPAHQRQQIPVIADDRGVLGVYGIGVNLNRVAASIPAVQVMITPLERE